MAFEEDNNLEMDDTLDSNENLDLREDLADEAEEDAPVEDIEALTSPRSKNRQPDRHVLEVRRAIEDHMEKLKLRKELDYLFDDEADDT